MDANGVLAAIFDETNRALRISPEGASSGRELQAAESTTVQATTSFNSEADVTGLSITFTVATRPVYVEVWLPYLLSVTAALSYSALLTDAANTAKQAVNGQFTAGAQWGTQRLVERISTPGTYTRKVRLVRFAGTGTLTCGLNATTTANIRAIEA